MGGPGGIIPSCGIIGGGPGDIIAPGGGPGGGPGGIMGGPGGIKGAIPPSCILTGPFGFSNILRPITFILFILSP